MRFHKLLKEIKSKLFNKKAKNIIVNGLLIVSAIALITALAFQIAAGSPDRAIRSALDTKNFKNVRVEVTLSKGIEPAELESGTAVPPTGLDQKKVMEIELNNGIQHELAVNYERFFYNVKGEPMISWYELRSPRDEAQHLVTYSEKEVSEQGREIPLFLDFNRFSEISSDDFKYAEGIYTAREDSLLKIAAVLLNTTEENAASYPYLLVRGFVKNKKLTKIELEFQTELHSIVTMYEYKFSYGDVGKIEMPLTKPIAVSTDETNS